MSEIDMVKLQSARDWLAGFIESSRGTAMGHYGILLQAADALLARGERRAASDARIQAVVTAAWALLDKVPSTNDLTARFDHAAIRERADRLYNALRRCGVDPDEPAIGTASAATAGEDGGIECRPAGEVARLFAAFEEGRRFGSRGDACQWSAGFDWNRSETRRALLAAQPAPGAPRTMTVEEQRAADQEGRAMTDRRAAPGAGEKP